jgi:hypothetical protein
MPSAASKPDAKSVRARHAQVVRALEANCLLPPRANYFVTWYLVHRTALIP